MLHARAQQQHVDRLHRHTIHTTSAGMAYANGPTARWNRYFYQLVVGTGATSGVELWRRRYHPKGDGCYLSTDKLRMCVLSTAAVASLSLPLCVCVSLKKNQNAPRPSEHRPVRGEKCRNV